MDSLLYFYRKFEILSSHIFSPYSSNSIMASQTSDVSTMIWLLFMFYEFWLISLLNVVFKIITKVLANRLCPHIFLLVDQVQLAFTKNRYILDSVACAHVLMRFLRLYIISILRLFFLSFTLKRLLILSVGTFIFSYYWQEGLGNFGLAWLNLVCSLKHHSSLLMGSPTIIFNVIRFLVKETLSPLPLYSYCRHCYTNPLPRW